MERSSTATGTAGQDARPTSEQDEDVLLAALAQAGVHPAYREAVRRCAEEPDEQWRFCCGSSCDPCVQQIGRAVDAYRERRPRPGI
jgi:hypothetical protein